MAYSLAKPRELVQLLGVRPAHQPGGHPTGLARLQVPEAKVITEIGFSTPKRFNPLSWLVRKMTGSKCSHAWFRYFDNDFEMYCVMEAHEFGFRIIPWALFEKLNTIVKVVTPQHDIEVGLQRVAREYLGTSYDYMGLVGMAFVAIGRFFKNKWNNPFKSSSTVFCSEAVARAMVPPEDVEPQDLLTFFEKVEGA
jgi:hypothetical protein